ncbi:hypothetical protein [Desulfobacter latus]|uniref:Zinc finger/thioredoxin putative domain-containing protein n=1 Tax=Desulfobacter latus TaxID=2292 RepID=A0A850SSZ6_9BACT|nr:hypothetical protein [Desulfobacter latus]NWH04269.1 hypothetical protein [Desulfobacter latus]
MISQCPHCNQPLKFSQPQMEKFKQALAKLPTGRALKFGCPRCRTPIEINKNGALAEKAAVPQKQTAPPANPPVSPPEAPDIAWLASGVEEDQALVEDVPTAMVLINDPAVRQKVTGVLEERNLQIHCPENVDEAVAGQRFKTYDVVVYSTEYEDGPVDTHDFHKFMSGMSMKRRRSIFYVLVGNDVSTLYDLEALTLSANLVVNIRELPHFAKVFQKGMKGYESLLGPYISILKQHGKS